MSKAIDVLHSNFQIEALFLRFCNLFLSLSFSLIARFRYVIGIKESNLGSFESLEFHTNFRVYLLARWLPVSTKFDSEFLMIIMLPYFC
jgi:hypothetical protein